MIYYNTNWMGPISIDWYKKRGLVKLQTKIVSANDKFLLKNYSVGDTISYEKQTEMWSGGRIDVYGDVNTELSLPVMRHDCYYSFSLWLRTVKTNDVWTLDQLTKLYEYTNPKIIWASDIFKL